MHADHSNFIMGNHKSKTTRKPVPALVSVSSNAKISEPSKPEPTAPEPLTPLQPSKRTPQLSKPDGDAYLNWDFRHRKDTCDETTSIATISFAEGTSRRAYRAMYWKPAHKYGMKAVAKEYKDQYQWAQSDWDTAVSLYEKANELAKAFNQAMTTGRQIQIVDYEIQIVIATPDNTTRPKLNEYLLVEDYLEGEFEKYISNTGYVNPICCIEYVLMPAFTHWSWLHTRGDLMITDLQGVRYDDKYVLTDPCILSMDKRFGAMDNSVIGMALFFTSHVCNSVCRALKIDKQRPDTQPIEEQVRASPFKVQQSTSYILADDYAKMPTEIKTKIKEVLQQAFETEIRHEHTV